jgi:tRNA (mo5U34)-methyltransferase
MSAANLTQDAIRDRVRELGDWFHNINLRGVQTAPDHFLGDYPAVKWQRFEHAIPADLSGRSVLDVGCNGGFYAIEMKRRGASRVVAVDSDERYLAQARFAAEVAGVDVDFHQLSVYELPRLGQRFDIVLFMGVLYHLRHPLLALDILHDCVADDLLIFQSMLRGDSAARPFERDYEFWEAEQFRDPAYPALYFVEHRYAHDPTNWWIPNRACAEAMLRSAGFDVIDHPEDEVFICRRRAAVDRYGEELPAWLKR